MNPKESALLQELTGGAEPKLLVRSRTRIDAGCWWRGTPVWLCITGNELLLFAVARRRYVDRVAIEDCHASHYSHAAGELMIKPSEKLRFGSFALSPKEALSVLDFLKNDPKTNPQTLVPQP